MQIVELTPTVEAGVRKVCSSGIAALDASHLASAGAVGADAFLTCDDILENRARKLIAGPEDLRMPPLPSRVMNPVLYWDWVTSHE